MKIPDNLRIAGWDDFIEPGEKGKLIVGLPFFVHTYHSDELEPHKTWKGMDLERWKPWLMDRRVYIDKSLSLRSRQTTKIDYSLIKDI